MKITRLETFLANAGLRNYLFVRLSTDSGLHGIGEATQKTVETILHECMNGSSRAYWAAILSISKR